MTTALSANLRALAHAAKGFMPEDEGDFLFAQAATALVHGPGLEIGSYCGKSGIYLGAAAQCADSVVFTVDHHRGSEEIQAGWEHHDSSLVDPELGKMDTLPTFRKTIGQAGLEDHLIAVVGRSTTVARYWRTPLAFLFIDGGHGTKPAHDDYEQWTPRVQPGGALLIHDVFPDPADGGRPPYEIYLRALSDGFEDVAHCGSMRALRRTS